MLSISDLHFNRTLSCILIGTESCQRHNKQENEKETPEKQQSNSLFHLYKTERAERQMGQLFRLVPTIYGDTPVYNDVDSTIRRFLSKYWMSGAHRGKWHSSLESIDGIPTCVSVTMESVGPGHERSNPDLPHSEDPLP